MGIQDYGKALSQLEPGYFVPIGNLELSLEGSILIVSGWTQTIYLENVTRRAAIRELKSIIEEFETAIVASTELKEYVQGKPREYRLLFDDLGKTSLLICVQGDDGIYWAKGFGS